VIGREAAPGGSADEALLMEAEALVAEAMGEEFMESQEVDG